ncbi:MAG: (2Fe-2S) ferredoxin domain-containing protein [Nannocystis sp.]|nr:(2Fe-2S) ferredoxin domain-containing protein [Nannocystis sp.]MBA3548212.1 (2Fe-2S) ferredoxin domain-containing protein [Nannocystis sp.]
MKQPASLVFVCQNLRASDDPKGSCMRRGSNAVLERMKDVRAELGLKSELRVMGATCLGCCESGVTVLVVDKDGANYYGRMDPALGEALLREQVVGEGAGEALRRHRLRPDDLLDLSGLEVEVTRE